MRLPLGLGRLERVAGAARSPRLLALRVVRLPRLCLCHPWGCWLCLHCLRALGPQDGLVAGSAIADWPRTGARAAAAPSGHHRLQHWGDLLRVACRLGAGSHVARRDGLRQPCRWRVVHETIATAGTAITIAAFMNSVSLITHIWKKCRVWSYGAARRMR